MTSFDVELQRLISEWLKKGVSASDLADDLQSALFVLVNAGEGEV